MRKRTVAVLMLALLMLVAIGSTAQAATPAANAFGLVYAGQDRCIGCHETNGISSAYLQSRHGAFMAVIDPAKGGSLSLAVPSVGEADLWPSPPGASGGIQFNAQDLFLQVGAPGVAKEYIGKYEGGDTTDTAGSFIPALSPADDYPLFDPIGFDPVLKEWEPEGGPVITVPYFQRCGGCHNLGLTRPANATVTLGSGAAISPTTPTAWSGLGIQCENCHGSGEPGSHMGTGTKVLGVDALASEACGQCHVSGSTTEKRLGSSSSFSNPNGYTPDEALADYFKVYTPADDAGSANPRFYPSGHNRTMNHVYYNEWNIEAHADSRASLKDAEGKPLPNATGACMQCHSAEGYLKANGYDTTILAGYTPAPGTDKYDIECAVCHNVHDAKSDDPLSIRGGDEVCATCHTAQIEEGAVVAAEGLQAWTPTQKEMVAGYGLAGVEEMGPSMGDSTCIDCHMPETRSGRMSHNFGVMMPGDAAAWNVRAGGDSCTPCHGTMTRATLQGDIDGWQAEFGQKLTALKTAIAAAKAAPSSDEAFNMDALAVADANVMFLENDGSAGVHNMPYARAGIAATQKLVSAVEATATLTLGVSAASVDFGEDVTFSGQLAYGNDTNKSGEIITIARVEGASLIVIGETAAEASGAYSVTLPVFGSGEYVAVWSVVPGADLLSAPAKITVAMGTPIFTDVLEGHRFFTAIQALATIGVLDGYSDGTYRPEALLKRAQAAKMLVVAFDMHDAAWTNWADPTFSDVARPATQSEGGRYPFDYVEEAFANGVIAGYRDGTFRPYNDITRAQFAMMIVRIGGDALDPATAADRSHFRDLSGLSAEAKEAIAVCYANGIISGKTSTTFDPYGTATRGHAAQMMYKLALILGVL